MADRHGIRTRPFLPSDGHLLNLYREACTEFSLDVPYGYEWPPLVETAVCERSDGSLLAALTATICAVLNPFVRAPGASHAEIATALRHLSIALEYACRRAGAAEMYTTVPETLGSYHRILEHNGWERTAEGCIVFRKRLAPPQTAAEQAGGQDSPDG